MLNQIEPDGRIDRVMDKLKQDLVDLTTTDTSSADAVTERVSRVEQPAARSVVPVETP